MKTDNPHKAPVDLTAARALCRLLQRIEESSAGVSADQYRALVRRLGEIFEAMPSPRLLDELLDAYPAAAELYENMNYQHAGLCRSPLEASLAAETRACQVIRRASRRT